MVLNTAELCHDQAKVFSPFRYLDIHQFFDGQWITPIAAHGVEIVQAVGVRHILQEGVPFPYLLVIAVKITHHRFKTDNRLAIQNDGGAKDTVRRRMLRTHVHNDTVGFDTSVDSRVLRQGTIQRSFPIEDGFLGIKTLWKLQVILIKVLILGAYEFSLRPTTL